MQLLPLPPVDPQSHPQIRESASRDATPGANHRFVINMVVPAGDTPEVKSCEVIGQQHRNRFTFPARMTVQDVFSPEVCAGIIRCLSALSDRTEVVSLPSEAIELQGLTLARAHVMTQVSGNGETTIILRFKTVLGCVSNAFRPELGIEATLPDHTAHMSALVLTDIVMPLLDLCTVANMDGGDGAGRTRDLERFMDTLIDRSGEVRFQAELIKRFVNSASGPTTRVATGSIASDTARLINDPT